MTEHAAEQQSEPEAAHAAPATERPAEAFGGAPNVSAVLRLQRTAGNRAVNQVLARQPPTPTSLSMRGDPGWAFSPIKPTLSAIPQISAFPPPDVSAAIREYLAANRKAIAERKRGGSYFMEDLIAEIRKNVPKAAYTFDFQISGVAGDALLGDAPPSRPRPTPVHIPGLADKLGSMFPDLTKTIVEKDGSYLKIGVTGIEGRVKSTGPKTEQTTVKVGPGGVELENQDSQTTATLTLGWGDSIGFKTKVPGGTVFEAAVGKEGDAWNKWSISVSIPLAGKEVVEARPPVNEIIESVNKGYGAAKGAIGLIAGGAKPTDDAVKEKFKEVKPAVEKLGKAVEERKGASVTLKFGAEGAPQKLPTGETRQSTFVGLSLVVEF